MPAEARVSEVGRPSSRMETLLRVLGRPLAQLTHRPTLEGLENLPKSGPFLLVSNHSAGLGLAELGVFASLYATEVGTERKLAGYAHKVGFHVWPLSVVLREIGAVPSTYEAAAATLASGVPLLVFPGGDHETLRPIWEANKVDFGGRMGFLRIALKAKVPIIPMGIRGSHYTTPILFRSRLLAYLLVVPRLAWGGKRWAVSLLGAIGAGALLAAPLSWPLRALLIWLWLSSPLIMLPIIPWTIRFRIGAPLSTETLFGSDGATPLPLALASVESAVQTLVDR
jgi:1-acyl-sn-glycerol-3-phosphate acyltransferase